MKFKFLATISGLALAASALVPVTAASAATFSSSDFTVVTKWGATSTTMTETYTVTPTSSGGYLTYPLTPTINWHAGAAWNQERVDLNSAFEINAEVNLGSSDGADGMAFVLQPNSTGAVSGGGGLGYQGVTPSFATEFDTYANLELGDSGANGPGSADFMAFTKNGDTTHSSATNAGLPSQVNVGDLEDGQWRTFKFSWDPLTNAAKAYLAGTEILSTTIDLDDSVFAGTAGIVYWGFSAATGGANNLQQVRFADNSAFTATARTNTAPTVEELATQTKSVSSTGNTAVIALTDDSTTQSQWNVTTSAPSHVTVTGASITAANSGASTTNATLTITYSTSATAATGPLSFTVRDADGATTTGSFTVQNGAAPGIPFGISAQQSGSSAEISWNAPTNAASVGGVTDYVIQKSDDDGQTWTAQSDTVSSATSASISGLDATKTYLFKVAARNAIGDSAFEVGRTIVFPLGTLGFDTGVYELVSESGVTPKLAGFGTGTITVNLNTGGTGVMTLTTTTGLTADAAFNSFTNASAMKFTGAIADVNAALATLKYQRTSNGTESFSVQASEATGSVFTGTGGNNHIYQVVSDTLDWTAAKAAAAQRTVDKLGGGVCTGYLATITSAEENQFIYDKVRTASWLGGADTATEGSWYWVTDPDVSATKFWQGYGSGSGGSAQNGMYTNWNGSLEPNDSGSNEDAIQMLSSGLWNDLPATGSTLTKYIVEFGSNNCVTADSAKTANATVSAVTAGPPGAPTGLIATAGQRQVSLAWTAPVNNGGAAITDYIVQYKLLGTNDWSTFADGTATSTSATVTGLTAGATYSFQILAVTAIATSGGPASSAASATALAGAPNAPTALSASLGSNELLVSWTAPVDNGGSVITDYVIEYRISGTTQWVTYNDGTSSTASASVSGLIAGSTYELQVQAVNAAGNSAWAALGSAITYYESPAAVTNIQVTAALQSLQVSWTAPVSDGGSSLIDYLIYTSTNNSTFTLVTDGVSTATSVTITGLAGGTPYWVKVVAKNGANKLSLGEVSTTSVAPTSPVAPSPSPSPSASVTPSPSPTASTTPRPTPSASASATPSVTANPTPSSSPSPSPQPQVEPVPVLQPKVEPVANVTYPTIQDIPAVLAEALGMPIAFEVDDSEQPVLPELAPSSVTAMVNGELVSIELVTTQTNDGYVLKGDGFEIVLAATDLDGQPLNLDDDGNIVLNSQRVAKFSGTGFAPGSIINIWLFSDPTQLKEVVADENGEFAGEAAIPAAIPFGEHTLQLNGITEDGQIRSVAVGVVLNEDAVEQPGAVEEGQLPIELILGLVAAVGAMLLVILAIARRRKARQN